MNLGQRDQWRITGPLGWRMVPSILTVLGWALTTLIVAGLTGLVRRE